MQRRALGSSVFVRVVNASEVSGVCACPAYNTQPMILSSLQTLRRWRWTVRLVLAWFVMSMGVAVASPLVHPQSMELICSGTGAIKLLIKTVDGVKDVSGHSLDCPLCVHGGAPPPATHAHVPLVHPLAHALRPISATHITARAGAPLPPRGPPQLSWLLLVL